MADAVFLDAMLVRADFGQLPDKDDSTTKIQSLSLEGLKSSSYLVHQLRKPDFQRETNHWTPDQLVTFLKSFLDRELVPSLILWQSPSHVFVIDGAHRLSALRAWLEDDYGDGHLSLKFYKNSISQAQKRIADRTRKLVNEQIGRFALLEKAIVDSDGHNPDVVRRAKNMVTRSLDLQWVEGDAVRAETSFFKINTQGTPLHKSEELLLRNRVKPSAISARAIIRAGTGHKYWMQFGPDRQAHIEKIAKQLFDLLFQPEFDEPIKNLELPVAGTSSKAEALELLMDFIAICNNKADLTDFADDSDGSGTIHALLACLKVMDRISGPDAGSLGLHPAVYFYNEKGKHSTPLFLAMVALFARAIRDNNKKFFPAFTKARSDLEAFLIANKQSIGQAVVWTRSQNRIEKLGVLIADVISKSNDGKVITPDDIFSVMGVSARTIVSPVQNAASKISKDTKAQALLAASLKAALPCPICGGLVDSSKSLSYDHKVRVQDGGKGNLANVQVTHPFCNTGIKN